MDFKTTLMSVPHITSGLNNSQLFDLQLALINKKNHPLSIKLGAELIMDEYNNLPRYIRDRIKENYHGA